MKLTIALLMFCALSYAQDAHKRFDVASIRQSANQADFNLERLPGGHEMRAKASLDVLLRSAYNVSFDNVAYKSKDKDIAGWARSDWWVIDAKSDAAFTADEMLKMLQDLLVERFKLQVEKEQREGTIYVLSLDPKGFKGTENKDGAAYPRTWISSDRPGNLNRNAQAVTMGRFLLSNPFWNLRAPVINATGLEGRYDLKWVLTDLGDDQAIMSTDNLMYTLRKQFGLILQAKKGPVPTITITHAERPTEN